MNLVDEERIFSAASNKVYHMLARLGVFIDLYERGNLNFWVSYMFDVYM